MTEPSQSSSEFALHISHRDDDQPDRVVGGFQTRADAIVALDASSSWERDDREEFDGRVWHHVEDWPYVAVVVEVEQELG